MQKNIIDDFILEEVSFVKCPAQELAVTTIRKSAHANLDGDDRGTSVRAQAKAVAVRASIEKNLDDLARGRMKAAGVTFYDAYADICETNSGRELLKALDDVTAIQAGTITPTEIEALRG